VICSRQQRGTRCGHEIRTAKLPPDPGHPWRVYAVIPGAVLGGVLIAQAALGASLNSRRYNPTSSLNVRSQP